jgi:hypothetical protein
MTERKVTCLELLASQEWLSFMESAKAVLDSAEAGDELKSQDSRPRACFTRLGAATALNRGDIVRDIVTKQPSLHSQACCK